MSTIYDDVAKDARDDHRHNPPGYATRPTRRTIQLEEYRADRQSGAFDPRPDEAA